MIRLKAFAFVMELPSTKIEPSQVRSVIISIHLAKAKLWLSSILPMLAQ